MAHKPCVGYQYNKTNGIVNKNVDNYPDQDQNKEPGYLSEVTSTSTTTNP